MLLDANRRQQSTVRHLCDQKNKVFHCRWLRARPYQCRVSFGAAGRTDTNDVHTQMKPRTMTTLIIAMCPVTFKLRRCISQSLHDIQGFALALPYRPESWPTVTKEERRKLFKPTFVVDCFYFRRATTTKNAQSVGLVTHEAMADIWPPHCICSINRS